MSTQKNTSSKQREIAEEIWQILRETDRIVQETAQQSKETDRIVQETAQQSKETDRIVQETAQQSKETDRIMQETVQQMKETDQQMKETDRQMKETDRKINKVSGDWARKWGELVESLVEGNLVKLLNERNIDVTETNERSKGKRNAKDKYGNIYEGRCEIDIVARNGIEIVAVEVKTTLNAKDVDEFLYKLDNFTYFFPGQKDKKIYGAMAYLKAHQNADMYAKKQGLFTIKAVGNSAYITNVKNFKPKIFPV